MIRLAVRRPGCSGVERRQRSREVSERTAQVIPGGGWTGELRQQPWGKPADGDRLEIGQR